MTEKTNKLEQTEFDTECDVFYDEIRNADLHFADSDCDHTITPALEEFKKVIIENYKRACVNQEKQM